MSTIKQENDLTAVGRLAGRLGVDVDDLLAVARRLRIAPAMRVDGIVYFNRRQAERLSKAIRRKARA